MMQVLNILIDCVRFFSDFLFSIEIENKSYYQILETILIKLDTIIELWSSLVKGSIFYAILLAGFEDYNLIIHSYLEKNLDMYTYPVVLELYAEQLNFSFEYLELSHISTAFEKELKKEMDVATLDRYAYRTSISNTFWNFPWSLKDLVFDIPHDLINIGYRSFYTFGEPVIEDWYNYYLYLNSYYNYLFDLPLNYNKFSNSSYFSNGSFSGFLNGYEGNKTANYGLDFDISFHNLNYTSTFYGTDGYYDKHMKESCETKQINNSVFLDEKFKNLKRVISSKNNNLSSLLTRVNFINTLGNVKSKADLTSKEFYDMIVSFSTHSENLITLKNWYSNNSFYHERATYSWWCDLQCDKYLLKFYKLLYYFEDYVNSLPERDLFDFTLNKKYTEKYNAFFPLEMDAVIKGAQSVSFWEKFFSNIYDNYIWMNIIFGSIHTFTTEPHLIEENLYNFIISEADNSEICFYVERYSDFLKSREKGQDSFYNMVENMKSSGLLHKLPIKTDNLIFFMNMYEKVDFFYYYYLDTRLFMYKITHLKETFYMYYSYYIFWSNSSEFSQIEMWYDENIKSIYIKTRGHILTYFVKWVYPFIIRFHWGFFFLYVYFFSAFIKAVLPHNLGLYKNTSFKFKLFKKKKKTDLDMSHKLDYNIENIFKNKQNFSQFMSKLTNLESWIFNLDIKGLYKNSKSARLLKMDTKSRDEYISKLKKNSEYIYKNFDSFESLKHYENSGRLNYSLKYVFLIGKRANLKTFSLFISWALQWFKNLYFNIGRRGLSLDSFSKNSNILSLKWPEFITKFFQSYFTWPIILVWFTFTWILFILVMRFIWKAKMPLYNAFFKRGSFNDKIWFKTESQISKILNDIELTLNDVNKELNRFSLKGYKKVNKFTSLKQRYESNIPILRLQSTPGGRVHYFWNILTRFFFILWNGFKLINVDVNSKDFSFTNNKFIQKIYTFFYFIYIEYIFWRFNPLKSKKQNNKFFVFEYILLILFPLCFLLFPLFIMYYFICLLIYIYNKLSLKVININTSFYNLLKIWRINSTLKTYINFVEVIIYYILLFWRFIFFDSKTNNGLIVRFYVKFVYKWLCALSYFIYMIKGAYQLGSKTNNGFGLAFKYIYLSTWVYISDYLILIANTVIKWINLKIYNIIILINQINNKTKININFILVQILNYEFRYLFEEFIYNTWCFVFNLIKNLLWFLWLSLFYFFSNLDNTYIMPLFYYINLLYNKDRNRIKKFIIEIINFRLYFVAFKLYFSKTSYKRAFEFLLIQILAFTPVAYYWRRSYEKYKIFKDDRYDGKGFIHSLSFFEIFGIKINIFNESQKKLHVFLYHVGLSSMLKGFELGKELERLRKKRSEVVYKKRSTWLTTTEIIKLVSIRFYFFVVYYINDKYSVSIEKFEWAYRALDNSSLTSHWSLWKRFRFLYLDFKRVMYNIHNYKYIEKKKDKFAYSELKLAKKARRIFFFKAIFNLISLFFFKGKFKFTNISYFKYRFMPIKMDLYLDYNIKNVSPFLWFLAILYKNLYSNIFKYYYSGERVEYRKVNPKPAFNRLSWPGKINLTWVPLKSINWVYNTGRYVVKIVYSPLVNWPLRMVVTILGYLAKKSRSRTNKSWYKPVVEDLDDINREEEITHVMAWNALMDLMTTTNYNIAKIDFTRFELNPNMGLGKYFVANKNDESMLYSYTKVKKEFEKSLELVIDDDVYLKFLKVVYKNLAVHSSHSIVYKEFYQKHKISLSDIFDYRFADFVEKHYPKHHYFRRRILDSSNLIKSRVDRTTSMLLRELDERSEDFKKLRKNLFHDKKNDVSYLKSLDIFTQKEYILLGDIERKVKKIKKRSRRKLILDKQHNKSSLNWLMDSFFDIDQKENLRWEIPEAFKIADRFYHWSSYATIIKIYMEWYDGLMKESTINNVVNESKLLRNVWTNMLNNQFSDVMTDGGSAVNAYYSYAWDCLYHYHIWADDEDFDFNAQMNERVQEVFLHNYYVRKLGPEYFSVYKTEKHHTHWDSVTHSPLHYYRYFVQFNKWGSIYRNVSYISLIAFLYVLFYWPGEYVVNNHILIIPFSIWLISSIMYYYYYKPFNKIMKSQGIMRYKWDWRRHNPYAGDPVATDKYIKEFNSVYTRDNFFLWKDDYWGNILWIFTLSWYLCEWYETDAFRHRWFPWDYTTEMGIEYSLQDKIHDDALDRLGAGKNYFSLPYANTFRHRAHMDLLTLDNEYDLKRKFWDSKVGISRSMQLNDFINECTFYLKFFLCSDKARYKFPRTDITQCHFTPEESVFYMKYQLKSHLATGKPPAFDSPTDARIANLLLEKFEYIKYQQDRERKLLLSEEDSLSLYIDLDEFFTISYRYFKFIKIKLKIFYKWLDKTFSIWEEEGFDRFFSKDWQDRMDIIDYYYFHFSQFCGKNFTVLLEYIDFFIEILKNLF